MATIEKRQTSKHIHYHVKIRLKGYRTRSATFDNLDDAQAWALATERFTKVGHKFDSVDASKRLFVDLIERYKTEILPYKYSDYKYQKHLQSQLDWWKS